MIYQNQPIERMLHTGYDNSLTQCDTAETVIRLPRET
ncbi:hypothetical protein Pan110_07770 [Gimesia panareensis]|nr:hypothetical protein Pan110_07770 [Gimesia panareensis]